MNEERFKEAFELFLDGNLELDYNTDKIQCNINITPLMCDGCPLSFPNDMTCYSYKLLDYIKQNYEEFNL